MQKKKFKTKCLKYYTIIIIATNKIDRLILYNFYPK